LPYEESSRVPLIIHDPRHSSSGKGLRCDSLTGNVDLMPTILELAGVDPPAGIDGRSILPLYGDPEGQIRKSLPLVNVWGPAEVYSLAVVTSETKYIYWPWSGEGYEPVEELYDTEEDPLELENLAKGQQQQLLEKMRRIYDGFVDQWREKAVPYHHYRPFAVFFDRGVAWEDKVSALEK
ncbi:MAG: sulfatase/phosphatase domain-containing protein, partial [Verrucomicrobiota bacterium]|nr:sulfatase/phosphatase domain-containing protein [Verrucomicrobiota bacterium]